MFKFLRNVAAFAIALVVAMPITLVVADYQIKDGNSTLQTVVAFVCETSKICPAQVLIDVNGNAFGVTGNPLFTAPASGATFPISANTLPLPTGAATDANFTAVLGKGASTDISGTITTGGSYQTAAASNTARRNCRLQNPSTATEPLLIKLGTMAQPFSLAPGATPFDTGYATDTLSVSAATTGHVFAGACQ